MKDVNLNTLRTGNVFWYTWEKEPMACELDGQDLHVQDRLIDCHMPVTMDEKNFNDALAVEMYKEKEGIHIRPASLQNGFVFCYRKTAIRFFRYLHEYQNLYLDIKGKYPKINTNNLTFKNTNTWT